MTYEEWIKAEAAAIRSDGCTGVPDIRVECCHEHDLSYHYGRDPRLAYAWSRSIPANYWSLAGKITRSEADARFWSCNRRRSWFKWASPFAAWRWAGVRILGAEKWDEHRKVRP